MPISFSPTPFHLNRPKFLHFISLFLFIFPPSLSSSPSFISNQPERQQELAKIGDCVNRASKKEKLMICDPNGILSPKERHIARQLLGRFLLAKNRSNSLAQQSPCAQKGILAAGIVISHWPIPSDQTPIGQDFSLDRECQKFILLFLPIYAPNQISIIHGPGVPLNGGQLHFALEFEKPLFHQGRFLKGISAIFDQIRLLMEQSEIQRIYRVQIEERRRQGKGTEEKEAEEGDLDGNGGEMLLEDETMERQENVDTAMTQSLMALIASGAVLFSVGLCMVVFAIFYYISIVRHGGMACWGAECRTEKNGGVYFVKEVSLEGTTVLEELIGVP